MNELCYRVREKCHGTESDQSHWERLAAIRARGHDNTLARMPGQQKAAATRWLTAAFSKSGEISYSLIIRRINSPVWQLTRRL